MKKDNVIKVDSLSYLNNSIYTHLVSSDDFGMHSHEFIEVFYITNGTIEHRLENRSEKLITGDMYFMFPGTSHAFIRPADCTHRDIVFNFDFFSSVCNFIDADLSKQIKEFDFSHKIKLSTEQIATLENLLDEYNCGFLGGLAKTSCLSVTVITTLINIIIDNFHKKQLTTLPVWFTKILDRFQSIEYLSKGLPAILNDIPYNHIYVNRVFKKYSGQSLSSFLNNMRLKYAELALRTTSDNIDTIIESCGFSSPTFFFTQFKKKHGITPNKYRNQILGKH